jgi:PAS domain S-box-containing protein
MELKSHEIDFLLAIVEGTDDCIFVKDLKSRFLFVNPAMALLFKKSVDQIIGKDDFEFSPVDIANKLRADNQKVIQSGQSLTHDEVVYPYRTDL